MKNFKLCYIEKPFAFFTTAGLQEQWGDDWNDAPYEDNAGFPYSDQGYEIKKIAFETNMRMPHQDFVVTIPKTDYTITVPFSVKDINEKQAPWLRSIDTEIYAGVGLNEFIEIITENGGKTYT